jgi:hypothetical protein
MPNPSTTVKLAHQKLGVCDMMSAKGLFRTSIRVPAKSVSPSTTDMSRLHRHVGFVPTPEVAGLFDHLLGLGEQRRGHRKAERLGGSEVDE